MSLRLAAVILFRLGYSVTSRQRLQLSQAHAHASDACRYMARSIHRKPLMISNARDRIDFAEVVAVWLRRCLGLFNVTLRYDETIQTDAFLPVDGSGRDHRVWCGGIPQSSHGSWHNGGRTGCL